jgi:hypothetical protein
MKYMTAIVASMLTVGAQAQYTVKITLKELPSRPLAEVVYIAGNFNNWNPKDENFRLQKNEKGLFFIEIKDVESADYEFKFTRGSWDQGETNDKGTEGYHPFRQLFSIFNSGLERWVQPNTKSFYRFRPGKNH